MMEQTTTCQSTIPVDDLKSPYYGMMYLGLANAAYTSEGDSKTIAKDLQKVFSDPAYMPPVPCLNQAGKKDSLSEIDGSWSIEWGPAISSHNSNMIYIVSYSDTNGKVLFYTVGVRGTDTSASFEGILNQLAQDINDFELYSWQSLLANQLDGFPAPKNVTGVPATNQKGNVSKGSIQGFLKLTSTLPDGSTEVLADAINNLLNRNMAPVVVTGHSLGGNQTQMVAAYLDWQFGSKTTIIPQPFAPPTPGDKDFASLPVFQNGQFWYNTLDLVPFAYIMVNNGTELGLKWAREHLWKDFQWPDQKHGPGIPEIMSIAIDTLGSKVPQVFTRPTNGGKMELNGYLPDPAIIEDLLKGMKLNLLLESRGSIAQLLWQHFPPCYQNLLWEQQSDKIVYYNYQSYPSSKKD